MSVAICAPVLFIALAFLPKVTCCSLNFFFVTEPKTPATINPIKGNQINHVSINELYI